MTASGGKPKAKDYLGLAPKWCPGCGDFSLLAATARALAKLEIAPEEVCIVSGIGCSGSFPHYTSAYGMHSIHGRALPSATAIHLVNPKLQVIAVGGDGDGYGIGGGHFLHACRRNVDMAYLVMNNQTYGLTLGQASPTSSLGWKGTAQPEGVDETPVNPIAIAIASGATFVARGYSGEARHLQDLVEQAILHPGFALVDVFSPCPSFNKVNTYDFFNERVYKLEEDETFDPLDKVVGFERALEWGDRIPIGLFYRDPGSVSLKDRDPTVSQTHVLDGEDRLVDRGITAEQVFGEFF